MRGIDWLNPLIKEEGLPGKYVVSYRERGNIPVKSIPLSKIRCGIILSDDHKNFIRNNLDTILMEDFVEQLSNMGYVIGNPTKCPDIPVWESCEEVSLTETPLPSSCIRENSIKLRKDYGFPSIYPAFLDKRWDILFLCVDSLTLNLKISEDKTLEVPIPIIECPPDKLQEGSVFIENSYIINKEFLNNRWDYEIFDIAIGYYDDIDADSYETQVYNAIKYIVKEFKEILDPNITLKEDILRVLEEHTHIKGKDIVFFEYTPTGITVQTRKSVIPDKFVLPE